MANGFDAEPLNWAEIKFRTPLTQDQWFRLTPEWRLDAALAEQMTGRPPARDGD